MSTLTGIRIKPLPRLSLIVINFTIYQVNWLLMVLGQNTFLWLALLLIGFHLLLLPEPMRDSMLMVLVTCCGVILDGLLKGIGFFSFSADFWPIPLWLVVIWMSLGLLPNYSLGWLKGRWFLSATLGAIGGPLAYWAGVRLGVASFNWPLLQSLLLLAFLWACFWPLVMFIATKVTSRQI